MNSPDAPISRTISGKAIVSLVAGLLSFCFSVFAAIPGLLFGVAALRDIRRSQGQLGGAGLAWGGIVLSVVGILATLAVGGVLTVQGVRTMHTARSANNLRQISVALANYHDVYNALPYAGSDDPAVGLGLSWRVRILPYVGQQALYDRFNVSEPWDSPHNKALIAQMPEIYKAPGVNLEEGKTLYLGALGGPKRHERRIGEFATATVFEASADATQIRHIVDGTSQTIAVVEADPSEAAIWTQPDDWEFDPQSPRRGLGSLRSYGFLAAFADMHTALVPNTVSDADLRRLFAIQDGERFDDYDPGGLNR